MSARVSVSTWIGDQEAVIDMGRASAKAGKAVADVVRFGLSTEASLRRHRSYEAPRTNPLGRVVLAALAAYRAGLVE